MKHLFSSQSAKFRIFILLFLILNYVTILSAEEMYPVSGIPPALKENAHTIIRYYKSEVTFNSEKSISENITIALTILNENGENDAYFSTFVNSMQNLGSFKGRLFNSDGKKVKNLTNSDIIDQSAIDGGSLYTDNRIRFLDPKYRIFPFTVEYNYTIEHKQSLFFPDWELNNFNRSYQLASCIVKVPVGFKLNYKQYNIKDQLTKTSTEKGDTYSLTINDLMAIRHEDYSDYTKPQIPLIIFKTENFTMKNTKGSLKDWSDLGNWINGLNDGKDILPEATIAKVKELTADCKTDREKVRKIYEFMQQKTRYVSIQIGIGGFEPFDASTVDKTSYGDCKALSNYTKALLKAVGIKSNYCLIRAGSDADDIDETFPSSQFNHAIVCVPMLNDTLWLECTSQRMPSGFNGDFTDNRKALLIDGENSRLVKTRTYNIDENCTIRNFNIMFESIESGKAEMCTLYKGLKYEEILPVFLADNNRKEKMVIQSIKVPSFTLLNFNYTENKNITPSFDEKINISFNNYVRKLNEKTYILPLNFLNSTIKVPEKNRQRKSDVYVRRPLMEKCRYVFHLPEGYNVSGKADDITIQTKFGKYSNKLTIEKNNVIFERDYELYSGHYPISEYSEFRNFAEQVVLADGAMIQLSAISILHLPKALNFRTQKNPLVLIVQGDF